MALLNRAISTTAKLVFSADSSNVGANVGYSVVNNTGATGMALFQGGWKGTLKNIFNLAKERLVGAVKSLKSFYMEDLGSEFLRGNIYSQLNNIEWADTRLWDLRIDGLPRPFTAICPAIDANIEVMSLNIGTFAVGNTSWNFIEGQGTRNIQVTFQDDVTGTMEEFLYAWMDEISGKKVTGVKPIQKAGKVIQFRKLSRGKYVTSALNLVCIPDGKLYYSNNQQSDSTRQFTMLFAVLGIERNRVEQTFPFRDIAHLAAIATANLIRRNKITAQYAKQLNYLSGAANFIGF